MFFLRLKMDKSNILGKNKYNLELKTDKKGGCRALLFCYLRNFCKEMHRMEEGMKYLKQFGVIILISFVGEVLHTLIPLPIPASIYGLLILFTGLSTHLIPLSLVRETGKFLIEIMPVMFIPAAVGILESWGVLKPWFLPLMVFTLASTVIIMLVTGKITQLAVRREGRREREYEGNVD